MVAEDLWEGIGDRLWDSAENAVLLLLQMLENLSG